MAAWDERAYRFNGEASRSVVIRRFSITLGDEGTMDRGRFDAKIKTRHKRLGLAQKRNTRAPSQEGNIMEKKYLLRIK